MKIDGNTPLNLKLTVDVTNAILGYLSAQPYEKVAGIITSIQQQAAPQVAAAMAQVAGEPAKEDPAKAA